MSAAGDGARAESRVTGAIEPELVVGLDFTGAGRPSVALERARFACFAAGAGSNEPVFVRFTMARVTCTGIIVGGQPR